MTEIKKLTKNLITHGINTRKKLIKCLECRLVPEIFAQVMNWYASYLNKPNIDYLNIGVFKVE